MHAIYFDIEYFLKFTFTFSGEVECSDINNLPGKLYVYVVLPLFYNDVDLNYFQKLNYVRPTFFYEM